jgi:ABC-2 type transport system ATP-binding protein
MGRVNSTITTRALRKVYPVPAAPRRGGAMPPGLPMPSRPGQPPSRGAAGGSIIALDALDLEVPEGEFFGLLGPNGAGKTTTIGILTTRVRATAGEALVSGASVSTDPVGVRQRIGVVPQRPNPDRSLRVRENLIFHAAYFGIPTPRASERADLLLETLGLGERGGAKVDELSGGQQQRLMIARALMHEPRILFLDEPTVGLDPQARHALWDLLLGLHAEGRTIVMTTHYMEEAERLCDRLAIIDHGRLLALDTPGRLKAQAPGETVIDLTLDEDAGGAVEEVRRAGITDRVEAQGQLMRVYSGRGGEAIPALIHAAEAAGRSVRDIHLSGPSLETLFIAMTGRRLD